jgi:hypothetical protein
VLADEGAPGAQPRGAAFPTPRRRSNANGDSCGRAAGRKQGIQGSPSKSGFVALASFASPTPGSPAVALGAVDRGQGVDAISITDRVGGISFTVHPGLPGSRSIHIPRPRLSNDANAL